MDVAEVVGSSSGTPIVVDAPVTSSAKQSEDASLSFNAEIFKKRLKKSISISEKLKYQVQLEIEVNKELSKRNEQLKKELNS